jgi:hypothetical protein
MAVVKATGRSFMPLPQPRPACAGLFFARCSGPSGVAGERGLEDPWHVLATGVAVGGFLDGLGQGCLRLRVRGMVWALMHEPPLEIVITNQCAWVRAERALRFVLEVARRPLAR